MLDKIVLIGYALMLIVGGYFGFKKGSTMSLIMGLVSGLLVFAGLWISTFNARGSWIFLSCVTGLLSLVFLIRFIKTQAFMPSGMLLVLAVIMMTFCLFRLR